MNKRTDRVNGNKKSLSGPFMTASAEHCAPTHTTFPILWEAKLDLRVKTCLQFYRADQNQSQFADPWELNETAMIMQKSIKLTKHYNLKLLQIIFWVYPEKHSAE